MNTLTVSIVAMLMAVCAAAPAPGGVHGVSAVITGPAGIVTSHGPIGPVGHGGIYHGAPAVSYASVVSPAVHPVAVAVGGHGGWIGGSGGGVGIGHGGWIGDGGHGAIVAAAPVYSHPVVGHGAVVAVKGPATVPAVIAGPSGKIVADGLYGIPTHGHGHGGWGW